MSPGTHAPRGCEAGPLSQSVSTDAGLAHPATRPRLKAAPDLKDRALNCLAAVLALGSFLALSGCSGDEPSPPAPERQDKDSPVREAEEASPEELPIQKRLLGLEVNSSYSELRPVPSPDGNALYFTRENYPAPESLQMVQQIRAKVETTQSEYCSALDGMSPEVLAQLDPETREFLEAQVGECAEDKVGKEIRDWAEYMTTRVETDSHARQVFVSYRRGDGSWTDAQRMSAPINTDFVLTGGHNIEPVTLEAVLPDHNTLVLSGGTLQLQLLFNVRCEGPRKNQSFGALLFGQHAACLPVWLARRSRDGWTLDSIFPASTDGELQIRRADQFALAPDRRHLVFAGLEQDRSVQTDDGTWIRNWDLYLSERGEDGTWSMPLSLGETVNSGYVDTGATLAPDGRTLYFASNRPGGEGGLDIYITRRQGDGWLDWSEPENLGPLVNTPQEDTSLAVDASGEYGFLASGEADQQDIYEFGLPPDGRPVPLAVVRGRILLEGGGMALDPSRPGGELGSGGGGWPRGFPGLGGSGGGPMKGGDGGRKKGGAGGDRGGGGLGGFPGGGGGGAGGGSGFGGGGCGAERPGEPLHESVVSFYRLRDGEEIARANIDPKDGSFQATLESGERYGAYVTAPCYAGIGQTVDLGTWSHLIDLDLHVVALRPGAIIRLNNLYFEVDKAELLRESRGELDRLTHLLNTYSGMHIEIAGHTDSQAGEAYNQRLSESRVGAVHDYLLENRIDEGRLQTHGYGELEPVASNDTKAGRALNRRVEFRILQM